MTLSGAEWEGADYSPPTVDELGYYAAKGIKLIRLEIRWDRVQPSLYGPLNMNEVKWIRDTMIAQANRLGMSMIVDLHERSWSDDLNFNDSLPIESLSNFWRKLATQLHGVPGVCGYGIANEPDNTPDQFGLWQDRANSVISAIRSVDKDHYVFVCEDLWTFSVSWRPDEAEQIIDPANKLVYEAHSYWDNNRSGNYSPNVPPKDANAAKTLVENNLAPFVTWCNTQKMRCFVGEFGVPSDQTWLLALDYALSYRQKRNMGGAYWAGGSGWNPAEDGGILSIEPLGSIDSRQMVILKKYLTAE